MVTADKKHRVVGTRPIRHDGTDKVTGRAAYGADLRLPDMLIGRVKRSPLAHARIKRIDASKALAFAGRAGRGSPALTSPTRRIGWSRSGEGSSDLKDLARERARRGQSAVRGARGGGGLRHRRPHR